MAEEAAKHGYRVIAVSGDFDPARQQNQVKDFLAQWARSTPASAPRAVR